MNFSCVSVCFISFLLVGEVFPFSTPDDEPLLFDGLDQDYVEERFTDSLDEEPSEDYPKFFISDPGEERNVNTDENEVDPQPKSGEGVPSQENPFPDSTISTLESLTEKVDKLLSDLKAQQDKIAELEETNRRLVLKIDSIEQQSKTNSIILTNVHQEPNETYKKTLQRVLHVFNRIMRVRTSANDIAVALRADVNSSSGNKPIVIRFTNFVTKMKVLAASNRLSNTKMKVSSDYSEMVAKKRAALVPYLEEARAEGRRAYILYDKLVVDGVRMTLEELNFQEKGEGHIVCQDEGEQVEEFDIDSDSK